MGRDLGLGFGIRGEERRTYLVEACVRFEEAARHLRLARETAEIDDGPGMPDGLCPNRGGIGRRTARWRGFGGRLRGVGSGSRLVLGVRDLVAFGRGVSVLVRFDLTAVALAVGLRLGFDGFDQHRRGVAEAADVEARGDADRLYKPVGEALRNRVCGVEPGLGGHERRDLLGVRPDFAA